MPKRVNLLPTSERVRTTTDMPALLLLAGGVVVVFVLALGYYLLSSQIGSLEEELALRQTERMGLETQVAALGEYRDIANQKAEVESVVTEVYASRTLLSEVLSDFSKAFPENAWLTSLNLTAPAPGEEPDEEGGGTGQLSIQGNTYGFPDVATILVRLQLIAALRDIKLGGAGAPTGSVDPTRGVRGFSMTASVVNTQPEGAQLPVSKVEVEGL